MPPLLAHPPSPTTATKPCHLAVMILALLGLEGSQPQQLSSPPARPSPLTTATTPSLSMVILPQPQQLSSPPARPSPLTTATTLSLPMVILPSLLGLEDSQTRQLPSSPTHPTSPSTATTIQAEQIAGLFPTDNPSVADAANASVDAHAEHRFPAPSSNEGCRKPVLGVCSRWCLWCSRCHFI